MSRLPSAGHLSPGPGSPPDSTSQEGDATRPHSTRRPLAHRRPRRRGDGRQPHQRHHLPGARYRRLSQRIGKLKAVVANQHSILSAVWHVLSVNTDYDDLGGDYHAQTRPPNERYDVSPAALTVSATWFRARHGPFPQMKLVADWRHRRPERVRITCAGSRVLGVGSALADDRQLDTLAALTTFGPPQTGTVGS